MLNDAISERPLAIVGDEDVVFGFKALGFRIYAVKEAKEAQAALEEAIEQKAAICLVQEELYRQAESQITNYSFLPLPIFIPFAKDARMDLLEAIVKDIRLRATGTY